ncbi:MAG: Gfo/Idh/MocA family oxidoreductase, partial [Caldivirga sp.]
HLPVLSSLSGVEVSAIFGIPYEDALMLARRFKIPKVTDDWRSVVHDPSIDVVLVATPTYTHRAIAEEAIKAGKHVMLEKPIALTVKDGEELVKAYEAGGVKLMVAHCLRFWPEYVRARELMMAGRVGEPRVARAYRLSSHPGRWFRFQELSGGVAVDMSIHDLDYLRWTLGEVKRVYAVGGTYSSDSATSIDHFMATLEFENGAVAYVEGSWAMPRNFPFTTYLEIVGTKGLLTVDNQSTSTIEAYIDNSYYRYGPIYRNAYYLEWVAFLDWLNKGVKPPIEPSDAVEALRLALAINKSITEGRVVNPGEVR